MSVPLCYYGSHEPLPAVRELRAGPFTLHYESGAIRYVCLGNTEVFRRLYAAVRDQNWDTVPAQISNEQFEYTAQSFRITYDAEHREGEIHFAWDAELTGAEDGTITFSMVGEALSTFQRNRIGFCLLHPIRECAGARCRLEHGDGSRQESLFPELIAPKNPFKDLVAISHEVRPGLWAEARFEGDLFETEDQRNWTDASFKTFCTPLRLPFPVEVKAGTRIRQKVALRLQGAIPADETGALAATIVASSPARGKLPEIGLGAAPKSQNLTDEQINLLRALRPAHLRVELDLTAAGWVEQLRGASANAKSLSAGLEAALTVSDAAPAEMAALVQLLHTVKPPLVRVLLFHKRAWTTPDYIISSTSEALAHYDDSVPVYAGTTANFAELNRGRPLLDRIDGVCYAIQPQEHAFDNSSIVECCAAIADTVRSARPFCGDLPVAVTPITLRKRVNPYATRTVPALPGDQLPLALDVRQRSLFGAVWTLGVLKYLAQAGAASATFYEPAGLRGVMEDLDDSALHARFLSPLTQVFPLFHVLADANEFFGATVLAPVNREALYWEGLVLTVGNRVALLLANMNNHIRTVKVEGLAPIVRVRVLDETTFVSATMRPLDFRSHGAAPQETENGSLNVGLRPYAYVRIDSLRQ